MNNFFVTILRSADSGHMWMESQTLTREFGHLGCWICWKVKATLISEAIKVSSDDGFATANVCGILVNIQAKTSDEQLQ